MTSKNPAARCECIGRCGTRDCIGWRTWGKPCGVTSNTPHPVDGTRGQVRRGRCHVCREAEHVTARRRQQYRELLTRRGEQMNSLFAGGDAP